MRYGLKKYLSLSMSPLTVCFSDVLCWLETKDSELPSKKKKCQQITIGKRSKDRRVGRVPWRTASLTAEKLGGKNWSSDPLGKFLGKEDEAPRNSLRFSQENHP